MHPARISILPSRELTRPSTTRRPLPVQEWNIETGNASLGNATLVVTGLGNVTVSDPQGNTIVQAVLTPVADTSYLYGSAGELQDPCYGVFTFRVTTASSQHDVVVTFMDRAMLFSSFKANLPWSSGGTYDYLYGVAVR